MSDCRFGVSPVNYPDPEPDPIDEAAQLHASHAFVMFCLFFFLLVSGRLRLVIVVLPGRVILRFEACDSCL